MRRQVLQRRQPQQIVDNSLNKRWSASFLINNDQQEQTSITTQSPISTVLVNKLGITKEKADRACVATGFRSVQAATEWLLHRYDNDQIIRTEYLLLLCPDEQLNERIRSFQFEVFRSLMKDSSIKDRQHLRAMKLTSFFHIPDQYVHAFHQILQSVSEQFREKIHLTLHCATDSLLLVPDVSSRKLLEQLFQTIKNKLEEIVPSVSIVGSKKMSHLTLSHGLSTLFNLSLDQRAALIQLAKVSLDFERPIRWNLRLYSREHPTINEIVYRVISTMNNNGLLLKQNDLFLVLDNGRIGEQENVYGRSHSTGEEGHFPLKNLRKASETESWTLQKSMTIFDDNHHHDRIELRKSSSNHENEINSTKKPRSISRLSHLSNRIPPSLSNSTPGLIRLFCLRHGERVDFAFGPTWFELAFDKLGNYHRINLNLPIKLPNRRNPFRDFLGDSPITEIGASQARLTGQALAANDCCAQYCYSSPSLRCIQTAHHLLQGMGIEDRVKIRIEPGLFEFLGWYERGLPSFFNSTEYNLNDDEQLFQMFNIDKTYRPIIPIEKLSRDEKYLDYYNRSFKITQQITDKHKLTGANIFFIGHAATLEVCTRQLCSLLPRSYPDFNGVIRKVSYLGLQLCERNPSDGQWSLKSPPIPPLQHANNLSFDWQTMK